MHKYFQKAMEVISIESEAIKQLESQLDDDFVGAVDSILGSRGRLIIMGIGKSGIIGKKIAATLASTGTTSFFVHPSEAIHGDLGMISREDIILAISFSGETDEVVKLLPIFKENQNTVIALTGQPKSTLAKFADFHLNASVAKEACPLALAPTSSTTATLVLGDALAVVLMTARDFKPEQFARFHPGGSLGRRLLGKVKDAMITENLPVIPETSEITEVINSMMAGQMGVCIVCEGKQILGVITDGDIRRMLAKAGQDFLKLSASDIMTSDPITIQPSSPMNDAIALMDRETITRLLVAEDGHLVGVLKK
jgi:arabinose-5-phosphate isomerase